MLVARSFHVSGSLAVLAVLAVLAILATSACHDLPDLGLCGNGVIEEANGEDCDDSGDSMACTATCELKCTRDQLTSSYVVAGTDLENRQRFCPGAEYRCGTDLICRAPSGVFEPIGPSVPFDVDGAPVLGDVDNDGLLDLVGTSTTNIYIRFASTAGAPLGELIVQEAPSADAPYVIFDPMQGMRDAMQSNLRLVVPTEGAALLRADGERFTPELELPITISADTSGLVVRDPDPRFGDVVISVQSRSTGPALTATRIEIRAPMLGAPPSVPLQMLPPCVGAAPGAWRLVDLEAAPDRRSFVVITQRDVPNDQVAQPWHVCQYTHAGASWAVTQLGFAAPAPTMAVLANLDPDPCLEIAVRGDGALGLFKVDAGGPTCGFLPGVTPLPLMVAGTLSAAPLLLGAGQVVAGGLDELVLDDGVYQCTGLGDCGGPTSDSFVRVTAPRQVRWSAAALTDLNRDGVLDVVAARTREPDVDVVRGGATPNVYRASTAAEVQSLVAGDFDGDRLGDVAMVETTPMGDRLVVLYGTQEAIVGTARPMSAIRGELRIDRIGESRWIPSTRGADGIDDLLVLDVLTGPGMPLPAAGFVLGDAARLMTTPRFPPSAMSGQPIGAVAAGAFADPRGTAEVLALAGDRALLYNVLGSRWVGQGIQIPSGTTLAPPIATLREGAGRARAVARGAGNKIVVFSIRGMFTSCTADVEGTPVEVRGIDIDADGVDEVAVLFADGGPRSLQMFRVTGDPVCALERVLTDVLDGCVDVADAGAGLVAICRRTEDGDEGPARGIFTLERRSEDFVLFPTDPIAQVPGDGRFLTAGDYDGDGVLDVAVSVHRVDSVGIQLLRQCPRHDTRSCPKPTPPPTL